MNEILEFLKDYEAYINHVLGIISGYILAKCIETYKQLKFYRNKIKTFLENSK